MRRISRLGLAILALNLMLVGQELVCAHETEALEQPAHTGHGASAPHDQGPQPDRDEPPCDESGAQCCAAIAPCAIAGIPEPVLRDDGSTRPKAALIAVAEGHAATAPLEVATPPPRR